MDANDDFVPACCSVAVAEAVAVPTENKCCASCGIAAIDDIQLKPCPHCDLVEYCSDQCQQDHLDRHQIACKERAAELYDELLFKQPESSHLGDCPICFLPMPLDQRKSGVYICCCQRICLGCIRADSLARGLKENRCPFCRHLVPKTKDESEKLKLERAELSDPVALCALGLDNHQRGDYGRALKYWSWAAALEHADSMYVLSVMYGEGEGVEEDRAKQRALMEKASIAGHPEARYNLGIFEEENGNIERAVRHWIIVASLGDDGALKTLKDCYKAGHVSKDDYAAALRAYQAAVDAAKSPHRQAVKGK